MGTITFSTGQTCYPAVQGSDAVDPQVIVNPNIGWNATARSTDTIAAGNDGYVEFEAAPSPAQIVAGFGDASVPGDNVNPWLATHAFYLTSSAIEVYEPAFGVMSLSTFGALATPSADRVYRIQRVSGIVRYYLDDVLVYTSTTPSTIEVYLDVSLYRAGDYVDNPVIESGTTVAITSGWFSSELPATDVVFWGKTYATAQAPPNPTLYPYDDTANLIGGQIGKSDAAAEFPGVTITCTLTNYLSISGSIPSVDVLMGTGAYAEVGFTLPSVTASLLGTATDYSHTGWFVPQLPPLLSYLHGWTSYPISIGEDGGDPAFLPLPDVIFSGRTYAVATPPPNSDPYKYAQIGDAAAAAELPIRFLSYFDDGFGDWMTYEAFDILCFREYYELGSILVASLAEGLELTDEFTLYYFHDAELDEGVGLTDAYTLAEIITQLIEEGVTFSNALPQQDLDTIQYAVNAATGALTTYRNFGFTAFCRLGDTTYAVRPGGLYRLRNGDDAGSVVNGMIDFGDTDFGTAERKNVDSMYLGLSNDGAVFARLTDDNGGEHYYQVVQTQPTARVIAGRGTMARRYGLRLEIVDASNFELDNIEFSVGVSVRRRMP